MTELERAREICRRNASRPDPYAAFRIPAATFQEIKRCAAQYCWPRMNQRMKPTRTDPSRPTWRQWFEEKFGEDLVAYANRIGREKIDAT